MINVSNEFKQLMNERTDFKQYAEITFADGTVLTLNEKDFTVSSNSCFVDGAGGSSFPLGAAIEKQIEIELENGDDHLSDYTFTGAQIKLYLKLDLSETTETINFGIYYVTTPETYGATVVIQAVDEMYRTDVDYTTNLTYPATLQSVVQEICSKCNISLLTTTFKNSDFEVQEAPEGLTCRNVLAMAAMIACGYARMDHYGRLSIISYDFSLFDNSNSLNGGCFDTYYDAWESENCSGGTFDYASPYATGSDVSGGVFNPWAASDKQEGGKFDRSFYLSGDTAYGGTFNPWDGGDVYSDGSFGDRDNCHLLSQFKSLSVETDDVVITGVQAEGDNGETYLYGEEGYVLSLENDLIVGKEQEAVDLIGQAVVGIRFRPFSGDYISYPIAEFGDLAYLIDRKGNVYQTILTDINFVFLGLTTLTCAAESAARNSSSYYSQLVAAIIAARKNTTAQLTEYDKAVLMLAQIMANSAGIYITKETLEDGSTIIYLHNKSTVNESDTIWKMTADAFAVSTDSGKTWNAGLDSEGNAVVNVLSAIGINADWISTGLLQSKDGTSYWNLDTGKMHIVGELEQVTSNGQQSITIRDNRIAVYDAVYDGAIAGYIYSDLSSTVSNVGTLAIIAEPNHTLVIGSKNEDGSIYYSFQINDSRIYMTRPVTIGDSLSVGDSATIEGLTTFNGDVTFGKSSQQTISLNGPINVVSGGSSSLSIDSSGAVTITGLNVGTSGLQCTGDANFISNINSRGVQDYGGIYAYGGIYDYSDVRLKKNIKNSDTNALEVINNILFKEYDREDNNTHEKVGLIAQQLRELDEDLVEEDNNGVYAVNNTRLLKYALRAIQQLSERIDVLEGKSIPPKPKYESPYTVKEKNAFIKAFKAKKAISKEDK